MVVSRFLRKPAAGEDGDPAACLSHQSLQDIHSLQGRGAPARREHAIDAEGNQGFKGLLGVGRLVKCLVEGHAQRPGEFNERAVCSRSIVASVRRTPRTTPAAPSFRAVSMSKRIAASSAGE